uniref:Protein kinase domain-containing protein n=1 Tax=Ananas comosus var. bracteatus TaxID=296719 RepID=A0A6V7P6B8_ANACO|nr:unnamed protein product [Ananas comosus var. bracteatus]
MKGVLASGGLDKLWCQCRCIDRRKERKKKAETNYMSQLQMRNNCLSRPSPLGTALDNVDQENLGLFDLSLPSSKDNEELPMRRPVKHMIEEKLVKVRWEENSDHHGSGVKKLLGYSELSGNQRICRDKLDLISGFTAVGNDSVHCRSECSDSDEYDDDDDVGYTRQPIDDETWFLAHEIDYPSDDEKGMVDEPYHQDQIPRKVEEGLKDRMKKPRQDANSRTLEASSLSTNSDVQRDDIEKVQSDKVRYARVQDPGTTLDDEEAAAIQEQVRQVKSQEAETGFEEDKNFHVVLNSVIAGRYFVMENLGSAAFSKAIQAHDLHTGVDVCMKIIKNNKDFFDQGLDEIKLLKFVNKNDPADKHHILRLYDYFYYREHLFMVCELLKANLYEFYKFNRESGGEIYFTMPRLQSITIQLLEALQFLHGLGLIHCDLKPENILVKSYSRCEVKVIDLGSSCFNTDHLCSYIQSRSYRAPEVILGLLYDEKIDIWSLGCILAELCTGNVLFPNESPATILARMAGIIGPIDQNMLAKGRDTYKYFCRNHRLYERNQETNRLEYLIPKKTSLQHRLPSADQGFVEFVAHLLKIDPKKRPTASEALKHPWLSYPYEPISS